MKTSRRLGAFAAVLAAVERGESARSAAPTAGAAIRKPVAVFSKPGPYSVGVRTLTIGDRKAEVWYPAARKSVKGKHRDVYEIAKWLPQALQDLLASKHVKAPFVTDAYRRRPAEPQGPVPTRAVQSRLQRVARPIDVPHHPPRVVGLRGRFPGLSRARSLRTARLAAGDPPDG